MNTICQEWAKWSAPKAHTGTKSAVNDNSGALNFIATMRQALALNLYET